MSETVIKVENISKQYRLGKIGTGTFSHDLNRWWHAIRGKDDPYLKIGDVNDRSKKAESEYVWALSDLTFDVKQGDVIGIIGKNGSGKSTLLKILSRTTLPTLGKIGIKGRVASLLEVGTGFHPELTGKENIFLNGAILGMKKNEIARKFDEIVDFSGVEAYIETPVKRYSSGMYVRLAFAVAAHLESEILIVDEVLAVGDAEFQKKAIGKMNDISKGNSRTVMFVSHDMNAISTLTDKAIFLKSGLIADIGKTGEVINKYLKDSISDNFYYSGNPSNSVPKIVFVGLETSLPNNHHRNGDTFGIKIKVNTPIPIISACLSVQFYDALGRNYVHIWNLDDVPFGYESGEFEVSATIPRLRLYMGEYYIRIHFTESQSGSKFQMIEDICPFKIVMHDIVRSFKWIDNSCSYIEDCIWEVAKVK